jgi:fructose-1,6-bisphosphatase/inositol monophosphatase family enzyme
MADPNPTVGELFKAKAVDNGEPICGQTDSKVVFDRMLLFIEDAAEAALSLRAAGLDVSHKDGDLGQALTQADLKISGMLHRHFGPRVIEEETADNLGRQAAAQMLSEASWTFVADPIDGTKPYAGGLNGWGSMIAACRNGRPEMSVLILPSWSEARDRPGFITAPAEQRGLLIAAYGGSAYWAPIVGGRRTDALRQLQPSVTPTYHVGWLCNAAKRYTLDFEQGFFPWCESGAIADAALLATGRLDATVHNHKLWDLAPALPVFEALGFALYRWPDLNPAPAAIIDLFDRSFSAQNTLWLVCRNRESAAKLAKAILLACT